VAAASRAALHAEHRAQRWLAQRDDGLLADVVECVAEADGGGGLALACRGRLIAVTSTSLPSGRSFRLSM